MKNIIFSALLLSISFFSGLKAYSKDAPQLSFACKTPAGWKMQAPDKLDVTNKLQRVLFTSLPAKTADIALITIALYPQGNLIFKDYQDFITRNSKNILGETQSRTEKFSPVKEIVFKGRQAFEFSNETDGYNNPESKSATRIKMKESYLVIPDKKGFFALTYRAPAKIYNKYLPAYRDTLASFNVK